MTFLTEVLFKLMSLCISIFLSLHQLLSLSIRNRVFDGIATILSQSQLRYRDGDNSSCKEDRLTERCLFWILALLRGKKGSRDGSSNTDLSLGCGLEGGGIRAGGDTPLPCSLSGHTKRDLKESLELVSREKSKKGLLAGLLVHYF